MIENLTQAQIVGIMDSLPVDITFIDENDVVRYWNKPSTRMFQRSLEVLGQDVRGCHPPKSLDKVNQTIADLKSGRKDCVEHSIKIDGRTVHIKNLAVRDSDGKYLGIVEVDQDITDFVEKS